MKYDIYLAGPFFDEREVHNIQLVENILRNKGFSVFSPREHTIENGESLPNHIWGEKVFDMDLDAIPKCEYIVALYYGMYSDSGTSWEIGYSYALGKKIVIVNIDSDLSSLMVANGSAFWVNNIDELADFDFKDIASNHTTIPIEQK